MTRLHQPRAILGALTRPRSPELGGLTRLRSPLLGLIGLGAIVLALVVGCRGKSDLVEAELRERERELWKLRTELERLELVNQGLERGFREPIVDPLPPPAVEMGPVMPLPPGAGPIPLIPPGTTVPHTITGPTTTGGNNPDFLIKDISIGRPTGGIDEDGLPGDEGLRVTVVPRDVDGHAVKAPGMVIVTAQEVTPDGLKLPFDAWEVGPTDLRSNWRAALIGSGYQLRLPFRAPPTSEKLRIIVRFTTLGGRCLEAEKDVTIHPGKSLPSLPLPPAESQELPRPSPQSEELPPPKGLEKPASATTLTPISGARLLPPEVPAP